MAIRLLSPEDRVTITCEADKGADKTKFIIRPLLFRNRIKIANLSSKIGENPQISPEMVEILYDSVVEINGVDTGKGKVDFKGEEIKEKKIIELLPLDVVAELFGKVIEYNFLSEDDKKKSD